LTIASLPTLSKPQGLAFLASHVFIGDFYFVIIMVRGRIADPPPILPDFVAILFFLYMNHAISHQNNDKNIDLDQFVLT
jgi:hypothetical protein